MCNGIHVFNFRALDNDDDGNNNGYIADHRRKFVRLCVPLQAVETDSVSVLINDYKHISSSRKVD